MSPYHHGQLQFTTTLNFSFTETNIPLQKIHYSHVDNDYKVQLSVDMDALAREVLRRLGEGDLRIPSRCEILVDQLKSLGTPWAERTVGALEQTCYVKTGIAILSAYPDACPANLRRLLRAMARRPEAAASLGTPLTAARARCGG